MIRNYKGWVLVSEGPTGVYTFVGTASASASDLPVEGVGTGSVALSQAGKKYLYHEDAGWKEWS